MTQNTVTCGFIGFIDTSNILKNTTLTDSEISTFSYTATQNCYVRASLHSNCSDSNISTFIDGQAMFAIWAMSASNNGTSPLTHHVQVASIFPLMKGQILTLKFPNNKIAGEVLIKIYGMKYS